VERHKRDKFGKLGICGTPAQRENRSLGSRGNLSRDIEAVRRSLVKDEMNETS